jgi:hypothetical protein
MFRKQVKVVWSSVKLCFALEVRVIHYVIPVIVNIEVSCHIHSIKCNVHVQLQGTESVTGASDVLLDRYCCSTPWFIPSFISVVC